MNSSLVLILVFSVLNFVTASSAFSSDQNTIEDWLGSEQYRSQSISETSLFQSLSVAIYEEKAVGTYEVYDTKNSSIGKSAFRICTDSTLKANLLADGNKMSKTLRLSRSELVKYSKSYCQANFILIKKPKRWYLWTIQNDKLIAQYQSKLGKTFASTIELLSWLSRVLGYEAIVMDQHGDSFLVAKLDPLKEFSEQALVLKESQKIQRYRKEQNTEGLSLLKLDSSNNAFAVYRSLLTGKETALTGYKLILGAKKDLKR